MVDESTVRRLAFTYPETIEKTSYGNLAFFALKKHFVWFNRHGDLVVRMGINEREMLVNAEPEKYFYTDHYRDYPAILIRMDAIDEEELADLLDSSWRMVATAKLLKKHDEAAIRE